MVTWRGNQRLHSFPDGGNSPKIVPPKKFTLMGPMKVAIDGHKANLELSDDSSCEMR